ncbi:purple acid phosphatase [Acrasis kona]|uniref:Purple acid phosphatase n=1 Tax=Acrasis kona TaxID=1008807 RepID=A0AAW2ZGQ3_9EUKA
MVTYHAPLYPTSRKNDDFLVVEGLRVWAPLFSQYNVSLAFENHDHTFKRSKVIANNVVISNDTNVSNGTVFIGDGAMGVLRSATLNPFVEKVGTKYHFYSVTCSAAKGLSVKAVDESGII